MLILSIVLYLLESIFRPRNIGCCVLFVIATPIWIGCNKHVQSTKLAESLMTETICTIVSSKTTIYQARPKSSCWTYGKGISPCTDYSLTSYNVSYVVGSQMYSGTAPYDNSYLGLCSGSGVFEKDDEYCWYRTPIPTFETDHQYYCWYRTTQPKQVILAKNDVRLYQITANICLLIMLLCCARLVYLALQKEVSPRLKPMTETSKINSKDIFNIVIMVFANTILEIGILIGVILIMMGTVMIVTEIGSLYSRSNEVNVICRIKDKQHNKLKISYPFKELDYTMTLDIVKNDNTSYPIGGTLPCYYSDDFPHLIKLVSRWSEFGAALPYTVSLLLGGGVLIALFSFLSRKVN